MNASAPPGFAHDFREVHPFPTGLLSGGRNRTAVRHAGPPVTSVATAKVFHSMPSSFENSARSLPCLHATIGYRLRYRFEERARQLFLAVQLLRKRCWDDPPTSTICMACRGRKSRISRQPGFRLLCLTSRRMCGA